MSRMSKAKPKRDDAATDADKAESETKERTDERLDEELEQTFPASDALSITRDQPGRKPSNQNLPRERK